MFRLLALLIAIGSANLAISIVYGRAPELRSTLVGIISCAMGILLLTFRERFLQLVADWQARYVGYRYGSLQYTGGRVVIAGMGIICIAFGMAVMTGILPSK